MREFQEMDELAERDSPVHRFSAPAKLAVTVLYILTVLSFGKYDLPGVLLMALYPYLLFPFSTLSFRMCLRKMRIVLPLVIAVGLFDPLLNRTVWITIAGIPVSYGWLSFVSLALKGVLSVTAAFLLAATTRIEDLCGALRRIRIPSVMVTLILLTYRYIAVMTEEVSVMTDAYHLRAPRQKGIAREAWGSFTGQLILRSMDRAKELYASMLLRGYDGEFPQSQRTCLAAKDIAYMIFWITVFILLRHVPLADVIGSILTGGKI